MISTEDKIAAVERLITDLRWARYDPAVPEHATFLALKEIARDLRGRTPGAPSKALLALQRRLANAAASKTKGNGFDRGALAGIGEETIARWPCIRQSLERFGAEAERS